MKVVVCVRTLDEEDHIERFCRGYSFADGILVADGGSSDRTLELLGSFPQVKVTPFYDRVERNGFWRNPEGRHINFLVDWATREGADWVILDDCDSVPNRLLQDNARALLGNEVVDVVKIHRMYLYGVDRWFPCLTGRTGDAKVDGKDWSSLWAWRPRAGLRWLEEDPWKMELSNPYLEGLVAQVYSYPYALLHYFCLTPVHVERKLQFYRGSGQVPNMPHPLDSCGPLERLPEWAIP